MSTSPPIKFILGGHTIGPATEPGFGYYDTPEQVQALLDAFRNRGYKEIDTARNYSPNDPGASERRLGRAGAVSHFNIHTKVLSNGPGTHEPEKLALSIQQSLEDLQTSSVDTMFLHVPDRETPFEDTLRAMDEAHREGKFKHLGVSNYSAAEVEKILNICEEEGLVKPSVYQGHYNAIVRGGEDELFPLLRKHNMSFWAYSPAAGGLFSGSSQSSVRWQKESFIGSLYGSIYGKPAVQEAVNHVFDIASKHNLSGHEAVLRWVTYHSALDSHYGDGVIFGASKLAQVDGTLDALEAGPLPGDLAEAISDVYVTVKGSEPSYHL